MILIKLSQSPLISGICCDVVICEHQDCNADAEPVLHEQHDWVMWSSARFVRSKESRQAQVQIQLLPDREEAKIKVVNHVVPKSPKSRPSWKQIRTERENATAHALAHALSNCAICSAELCNRVKLGLTVGSGITSRPADRRALSLWRGHPRNNL